MTARITLPSKLYSDSGYVAPFDFTSLLRAGETISTQSVTLSVYSGTDASPSSMLNGSPTASGAIVSQPLVDGVVGTIYQALCSITTSASRTLRLVGYLAVLSNLP